MHKSAADSNLKRSPHRPAVFIAFNAWSHEHRFVVEPLGFRAQGALHVTRKRNRSGLGPEAVHEREQLHAFNLVESGFTTIPGLFNALYFRMKMLSPRGHTWGNSAGGVEGGIPARQNV